MTIKKKYKALVILILLLAIGGLFYNFFIQIRHVKAGEIGVKASIGNPIDNDVDYDVSIVRGYVVLMPLYSDFIIYPTDIQIASYDSLSVLAKDGVRFTIKPSVSYQLDEQNADKFYRATLKPLTAVNDTYLKEIVAASFAEAANSYTSDSLINSMKDFELLVNRNLNTRMTDVGLILKNTVSNIEYPQQVKDAIDLRSKAIQDAILADSKIKQTEAEGRIQAMQADLARREDSLRNAALTPLAIQKMFIDKWDGKLPVYGETPKIYKSITE